MKDEIIPHLTNVTPNVRHGTVRFIETLSEKTDIESLKKIAPGFLE